MQMLSERFEFGARQRVKGERSVALEADAYDCSARVRTRANEGPSDGHR